MHKSHFMAAKGMISGCCVGLEVNKPIIGKQHAKNR